MELTTDDLKNELTEQDYDTLTLGEDVVAVRSLVKAKMWVKGMIASAGGEYDEENGIVREAVLKRALYELFSFVGQESRAREKAEDCELLIESSFGPIIKKNDASAGGPAYGCMKNSRVNPLDRSC